MNLASSISKIWNESVFAFSSTGYSFFNIEAHVVCAIVLALLFNRQQNSSDQTEARVIWCRLLFVQVLYCLSGITMVLLDIHIIPSSFTYEYIFTALNFAVFNCMCWLIFIYTESCCKTGLLDSFASRIITAVPLIISVLILVSYPLVSMYSGNYTGAMNGGTFSAVILAIGLSYPFAAVIHIFFRKSANERNKFAVYPAFLFVFGVIQFLNWKMPVMCYAMMTADIFVYINYADSLVSVDPLTKIPNRNGFIRYLSDRMKKGNVNHIYVFSVDIDDLGLVNSNYGRSEGDHALIVTAGALKKFRNEAHKCYAARYYSDEFMIAADIETDEELELFTEHVRNYIGNAAISNGLQYHLRVSIGYSHYEKFNRTETVTGLIEEAERLMTENKEQRKFQNLWQRGINA